MTPDTSAAQWFKVTLPTAEGNTGGRALSRAEPSKTISRRCSTLTAVRTVPPCSAVTTMGLKIMFSISRREPSRLRVD